MRISAVVVLLVVFCVSICWGQTFPLLVTVDAENNCCMDAQKDIKECTVNATQIELPPGTYELKPHAGGVSRFRRDRDASRQGKDPWFWLVSIWCEKCGPQGQSGGLDLGRDDDAHRYLDADAALRGNLDEKKIITLDAPTKLYFWLEDEYQGKNACKGNRGKAVVRVEKLK